MRDKGVLLSACAMGHNVLKIRPPLVLSLEQAGLVVQALDESLATTTGRYFEPNPFHKSLVVMTPGWSALDVMGLPSRRRASS